MLSPDIRNSFPLLDSTVHGHQLVYLDNAATTQKPQAVIDALCRYYSSQNSNIHRGAHHLAAVATEMFEEVRGKVQRLINARSTDEIVFTRGTTESINLVAASYGRQNIGQGDEVIVSGMEHHSNIVPWQLAGATLRPIPFSDEGVLDMQAFESLFTPRTRMVAVAHVSNTLGTVNPVAEMARVAHAHGVPILVDGAQAVSHLSVDVQALDCDFYCFSGHKMYAPMGVGVMYGKRRWLESMPPYQGGGEMISDVTFEKTTFNSLPFKFEAGTPSVADVLGLGVAIDFMMEVGLENIAHHEAQLLQAAVGQMSQVPGMRFIGTAKGKVSVVSFLLGDAHPYDVGTLLDQMGIAVRTGHHCTQPVMQRYGIPGTVRASFAIYNTIDEVDTLCRALKRISSML